VALPLVLPPTVLGFYILVAIGPHSPLGRLYSDVVGQTLPFSFQGLLVASILYSLPFAVQPFASPADLQDGQRGGFRLRVRADGEHDKSNCREFQSDATKSR